MSGALPFVVVEEHHEAFYVWSHAIRRGWLAREGNTLLHVDEHSDMSLPKLRCPLRTLRDDAEAAAFTYGELDIGNFIWPAVYQGIFNRVLWLRHQHNRNAGGWRPMCIRACCDPPTRFVTATSFASTPFAGAPDIRRMEYAPIGLEESVRTDQPVVIDVDLDYFLCNEYPDYRGRRLEITRSAYEDFCNDRYHFLRIAPGTRISAVAREGGYYLLFNDYSVEPGPPIEDRKVRENVRERVRSFADFLGRLDAEPPLIVVCRSVHSGYLPRENADFVYTVLRDALERSYSLEMIYISDLLPPVDDGFARREAGQ